MLLSQLLTEYVSYHKAAQVLSLNTLQQYEYRIRRYLREIGVTSVATDITPHNVRSHYLGCIKTHPKSAEHIKYALESFFKYLNEERWLEGIPTQNLPLPKVEPSERCPVPEHIVSAILTACDRFPESAYRRRLAKATLTLAIYGGLRTGEIIAVELTRVDLESRCLRLLHCKGKKNRPVYLAEEAICALRNYLAVRPKNATHGYLLCYQNGRPLKSPGVNTILREALAIAGYDDQKYTIHQLRHAAATRLLQNGATIHDVQRVLGHSHIASTQRYLHSSEERMRAVAELAAPKSSETLPGKPYSEAVVQNGPQSRQDGRRVSAAWRWEQRAGKPTRNLELAKGSGEETITITQKQLNGMVSQAVAEALQQYGINKSA